jgi:hypothetical protein
VAGSYKQGNQPSGVIKGGEFPDLLSGCLLPSQEGRRYMELMSVLNNYCGAAFNTRDLGLVVIQFGSFL